MTLKRITGLPFAGFYGSQHDAELDGTVEQMFQNGLGDGNRVLIDRLMGYARARGVS